MRVLVTGHRGFIGPHLVELLKARGHWVTGCDIGLFDGCEWEELPKPDLELKRDVRSLSEADLQGYDVICHLAAISNDPMGDLQPEITFAINRDASIELAVPAPVITAALQVRFRSRQVDPLGGKMLAAMRRGFGGHAVKKSGE